MNFIDILNLTLSLLGIHGLVLSLRYLIPCHFIPFLSTHLNATQRLLNHAEKVNAIPPESEYRTLLDLSANQFAAMRVESNLAWWPFQQLRLAIQRGLTLRLCVTMNVSQLAIDQQQLLIAESAARTAVPSLEHPSVATAPLANDVVEPTLPLPATSP